MSQIKPRVVIVTFDAASKGFSLNPDPVRLPIDTPLYFALQTTNRGDDKAVFSSIVEDHGYAMAKSVAGSDELWKVTFVKDPAPAAPEPYGYTVRIKYAGAEWAHDPTVILDPPITDPPA